MSFNKKVVTVPVIAATLFAGAMGAQSANAADEAPGVDYNYSVNLRAENNETTVLSNKDYYSVFYDVRHNNNTNEDYAVITGFRLDNGSHDMNVPESICYNGRTYDVERIGDGTGINNQNNTLEKVTVADGVDIAANAFRGINSLKWVDLTRDTTANIGMYAFAWTPNMDWVDFAEDNDTAKKIDMQDYAFYKAGTNNHKTETLGLKAEGESAYILNGKYHFYGSFITLNRADATTVQGTTPVQEDATVNAQDTVSFTVKDNAATITGFKNVNGDGKMIVPNTVEVDGESIPVTKIGDGIKQIDWGNAVQELTVEAQNIEIAANAFKQEGNLIKIDLSAVQNLTVGAYAFADSANVQTVALPADVDGNSATFYERAFYRTGNASNTKNEIEVRLEAQSCYKFIDGNEHFHGSNITILGY